MFSPLRINGSVSYVFLSLPKKKKKRRIKDGHQQAGGPQPSREGGAGPEGTKEAG